MLEEKKGFDSFLNDLVCILVLYKCSLHNSETFNSLSKASIRHNITVDIIIYDNSPEAMNPDTSWNNWRITYIHDPTNPGISKAYNHCAMIAKNLGKKWILLLDQDTTFEHQVFELYNKSICLFPNENIFVPQLTSERDRLVSPSKYFFKRGIEWNNISAGMHQLHHKSFINSGLLITIHAFEKVGGYNERVKLYFSDYCFVEKLILHYKTFVICELKAHHKMNVSNGDLIYPFTLYCIGALQFSFSQNYIFQRIIIIGSCLLRAIKLSIKFRKYTYLSIFRNTFLNKAKYYN